MRSASGHALGAKELALEEALWLVSSFCALHRKAFDPALFAQRYPPPVAAQSLRQAADELDLIFEQRRCSLAAALAWRIPIAVRLRAASPGEMCQSSWALVLNADETRVAFLERESKSPIVVSVAELAMRFTGDVLSLAPKAAATSDPDDLEFRSARFGLRWFVPELLKHRRVWRDVLLASLALQLMALAIPLFTQTIIDKVVVHRTESTLIALGVGMAVFLMFTAALSWVRQYLILHTGQRIDAVLGSHVFDHLFRLPLLYFQHRPTGVIAARLQGVETIREFIASTAVTLALDLPFLLIFVAIMLFYSVKLTLIVLAILAVIAGMRKIVQTSLHLCPVAVWHRR